MEDCRIERFQRKDESVIAFMRQSENQIISVQTSLVLLAVGRTPELDDLSLDLAGVQVTDEGIEIGRDLCTSNP